MNQFFSSSCKALVIVALLSGVNASAMEAKPTPSTCGVVNQISSKIAAAPKAVADAACSCTNTLTSAFTTKKAEFFAAASAMKARGWTQWTCKEKAGVAVGVLALAAVAGYVGYKLYKSFTQPKKSQSRK